MIEIIGELARGADVGAPVLEDDATRPMSLQRQLIARLQQAIRDGRLPAGSLLPSSRQLADEMGVSRNTVVIAYDHLCAEGYVSADRRGTRVASLATTTAAGNAEPDVRAPAIAQEPAAAASREIAFSTRVARIVSSRAQTGSSLPLAAGVPALDRFALSAWRRAYDHALANASPESLGYGPATGEEALREAIAQHLRVSRGVRCEAAQVIVTEGAQEALTLCVRLLTDPGDTAWIEDPGYRGAKAAFQLGDLHTLPMPVDHEGIAVPDAAWRDTPPRLVYVTPSHQYPTGAVLPVARRLALIERARACGAWLIEDDYDGEYRHMGEPIASMQGLVPDAPVVYVGSFSKTMFPALRVGFAVLPKAVADGARVALHEMLRGGHRLEQLALARFIDSGEFARHLGRMRRLYRERQQALRDALAAHIDPPSTVLGGHCGMHLTMLLPAGVPDREVAARALEAGCAPRALSAFALRPEGVNGLVIGYGNTAAEQLAPAVRTLAGIIGEVARECASTLDGHR